MTGQFSPTDDLDKIKDAAKMLERIYITRHGHRSSYSQSFLSSPTGVRADPALAAHGIAQTRQLTKHLLSLPHRPQKVYSSPMYRCIQTIIPFAQALNLPIYLDEGIGEWYGLLHHSSSPDHPVPVSVADWPKYFPNVKFRAGETEIVGNRRGETMAEIHQRVQRALEVIIARADEEGIDTIILCTHAATNIALGRALVQDPEAEIRTGTASLGEYVRDTNNTGKWTIVRNGDTSFLSGGEERNWWFDGDIPGDDPEITRLIGSRDTTEEDKSKL